MNKIKIAICIFLASLVLPTVHAIQADSGSSDTGNGQGKSMQSRRYSYGDELMDEDVSRIEGFRQMGLQRDASNTAAMIDALKNPPHLGYTYTTINALAQLGATEALPVIDTYIQEEADADTGGDLSVFSKVAKARLLAESEAKLIPDTGTASEAKVRRFYRELGMTPADLNADLVTYYHPVPKQQGVGRFVTPVADVATAHPIGVYAVRELADIVYHGSYRNFMSLPDITQVNFSGDYPSALKVRLAPLSPPERLNTMIQELAHKKFLTHWDDYEIQLASNEGLTASHAAAAQLTEMENHPEQYSHIGFTALVRVMWGTGDKAQAPLVRRLLKEGLIYTGNLPIADLSNGIPRGREPAY